MERFGGKFDLTYYGVVLGGTVAGVIGMFNIYVFFTAYDPSWQAVLSIALMIPTLPLLYISISSMIGFGLFKHKFMKFAGWMVFYKTIFNVLFILWYLGYLFLPPEHGWEWMAICIVFAVIMYRYSTTDLLPSALPEKLKKHRRRKRRQEKQKR
jgi:hypothetical protein